MKTDMEKRQILVQLMIDAMLERHRLELEHSEKRNELAAQREKRMILVKHEAELERAIQQLSAVEADARDWHATAADLALSMQG